MGKDYDPSRPCEHPRHEILIQAIVSHGDRMKALEKAGYSTRSSRVFGRLLRDQPHIANRIDWLQAQIANQVIDEVAKQHAVSRDEVVGVFRNVIEEAQTPDKHGRVDYGAICKAAEGLGRSIGLFTDRKIVENEHPDFELMDTEQLQAALIQAASLMDPNELRAFLGSQERSDRSAAVGEQEQAEAVPAVPKAGGVPSTRH